MAVPEKGREPLESRFRAVFVASRDAIGVSRAGVHLFVNPAYLALFGFPAGTELAGTPILDLIAPENRDQVREYVSRREAGAAVPPVYETRGLRSDGSAFDLEVSVSRYREGDDELTLAILRDVTVRRRTERESAERGETLRQIMDAASVAIFLVDNTGRITHANRRMAAMFGCPMADLIGSEYVDLVHPSEREVGRRKMLSLLASEVESVDLQRHYWRRDGSEFWGHLAGRRFHDADGVDVGLIGVITDVDAGKQAEDALRQSAATFRRLYNETPILLHSIDRNGIVVEVNDYWLRTLGYARDEVLGRPVIDFYTAESRRYALEVVQPAFFRDGVAKEVPYQFVRKNGVVVDVLLSATAERDADGAVTRSQAVIVDVTERKRAEEALRQSEARYRMLYEGTPVMMHSIDTRGRLVSVSNEWLRALGYEREEVLGRRSTDFLDEQSRTYAQEVVLPAFMKTGVCANVPYTFVTKNGRRISTLLSAIAERDKAGHVVRSLAVIIDVTERARAEAALRESEERYRDLAETLPLTVFEMDLQGRFTFANQLAFKTFGYTREEFLAGLTMDLVLAPEDVARARHVMARRLKGETEGYQEYQAVHRDGTRFPVTVVSTPILRGGAPVGFRGIVVNLTERKQLEEERLKAQKLESIGTLAGGIAHDFNNLLQGVFGYISMARESLDAGSRARALLERAEQALHQSVSLTTQLLTFSKGGKPVKKVIALRPVVESAVRFALSGSRTAFTLSFDEGLSTVEADEGQLGQVFQNIAINAEQAMPSGGSLTVTARNLPAAPAGEMAPGPAVEVIITDQGIGIPPEHLPRIFDPYYTTKTRGSGLGLATVYTIVRNHGGAVAVSSEPGRGTSFSVYLPDAGAPVEERAEEPPRAASRAGRILVMDDEALVRDVVRELLHALGHEAEFAVDGDGALERYRASMAAGKPFDVVILDLTIRGGMGGGETLLALLAIDPAVKAVVSSGYSDDATLAEYRQRGFRAFLKKPFVIGDLKRTLDALLA